MVISNGFPFNDVHVSSAPRSQGFFFLFGQNGILIYAGRARGLGGTIRSCLRRHLCDAEEGRGATHYRWLIADEPVDAETAHLAQQYRISESRRERVDL
jgi:hypothetical protein